MKYFTLILCCIPLFSKAQTIREHPPLLKVYLDHFNPPQSANYLKTAVEFINYTDKPANCDIRVQLTKEDLGNESIRYRLYFYGKKAFFGQNDTTECVIPPMYSSLVLENQLTDLFKEGLLPYLLQTEWRNYIQFSVDSSRTASTFRNSWHRNTFVVGTSGSIRNFSNEESFSSIEQKFTYADVRLAWWHIDQRWRWAADSRLSYNYNFNTFSSATPVTDERTIFSNNLSAVRSLTPRLSAGGFLGYQLQKQWLIKPKTALHTALGLEYSLFPYTDFFRRRLLFGYYLGVQRYINTYNLSPTARLPNHEVLIQYAQRAKKAYFVVNTNAGMRFNPKYWNTWNTAITSEIGLEVTRNLFLTLNLQASATNDRSVSVFSDDIQSFFTNHARVYQYSTAIGITYLPGSGYRNILNPMLKNNN